MGETRNTQKFLVRKPFWKKPTFKTKKVMELAVSWPVAGFVISGVSLFHTKEETQKHELEWVIVPEGTRTLHNSVPR
jgi:hypothetical protein